MKLVGILAFAAVLVVAFGYFTIFGGSPDQVVTPSTAGGDAVAEVATATPEPEEREQFAGAGTMRELYERNESLECQINPIV